jgi:serine phosphatase RsbU (regulator of sigma subunit)
VSESSEALRSQVDRLEEKIQRQGKLVEASYALHTSLDLGELLGLILDGARDGVEADRGTVFLLSEDGNEIWSRIVRGEEALEIRLPLGKGIAGTVAQTGETIRIDDAYEDQRFDPSWDKKSGYRTREILCAPIRNRAGEIVGVFQLLNKRGERKFTDEDEQYLESLSIHAALAVENARLHSSALEKERYDREVQAAQDVQRKFQPRERRTEYGNLELVGINEFYEDATGDYYDFLSGLPGGRLGVAVGDVSGHGLHAALVMAEARAFLRAFARTVDTLPPVMDLVNDHLVPDMEPGKFMTLFACLIDGDDGTMEWVNAAQTAPMLYRKATGEVERLKTTGLMLGFTEQVGYKAGPPCQLEPGDALLMFTDGISESRVPKGELFGEDRLVDTFRACADRSAHEIIESLRGAVQDWVKPHVVDDDLTLVVVKRK